MQRLIADIEANGFIETVTEIHCICLKDYDTGEQWSLSPMFIQNIEVFNKEDVILIGHNFIDYDLPVLEKILGFKFKGKVLDTLILSQIMEPERTGGHSLEAWGETLGYPKVQHEDWSVYSEEMLHRCKVDVEITEKVLRCLEQRAGGEVHAPRYEYDISCIRM